MESECHEPSNVHWTDAWMWWWEGHKLAECTSLWGVSMLWWSRYGQITQLIGAFMVVFDVMGPQKMREAGAAIQKIIDFFGKPIANLNPIPYLIPYKSDDFGWGKATEFLFGMVCFIGSILCFINFSDGSTAATLITLSPIIFYMLRLFLLAIMVQLMLIGMILSDPNSSIAFKFISWLAVLIGSTFVLLSS